MLTGLWFLLSATLTLLRVARPVDVDELIDSGSGSMASYPRKYDIYSREGGSEYSEGGGVVFGMAAGGGGYPSRAGGLSHSVAQATERNSLRNSLTIYSPNAQPLSYPLPHQQHQQHHQEVEMRLSGSRLATQPIRRPTPPKRAGLGSVLDQIPEPALTLSQARVPSSVAAYEAGGEDEEEDEGDEGGGGGQAGHGGLVPEYMDGDGGAGHGEGARGKHVMLDFESGIAEDGGDGTEELHVPQRRPFS